MAKSKIAGVAMGTIGGAAAVSGALATLAGRKSSAFLNSISERMMGKTRARFAVTECDTGKFSNVKLYNVLRIPWRQYSIEGLGNLATVHMHAGPMQMSSFILTPFYKDVPLCSIDIVAILGTRKTMVEFYDLEERPSAEREERFDSLAAVGSQFVDLKEIPKEPAWYAKLLAVCSYKESAQKDDARLAEMIDAYMDAYLELCAAAPQLSPEEVVRKCDATRAYTNGLLEQGGVSTDLFKKALGEATTRELFDTVMFGTQTCEV